MEEPPAEPSTDTQALNGTVVAEKWQDIFIQAGIPVEAAKEYSEYFVRHEIRMVDSVDLTHELLKEMGVQAIGHRLRILKAIADMRLPVAPIVPVIIFSRAQITSEVGRKRKSQTSKTGKATSKRKGKEKECDAPITGADLLIQPPLSSDAAPSTDGAVNPQPSNDEADLLNQNASSLLAEDKSQSSNPIQDDNGEDLAFLATIPNLDTLASASQDAIEIKVELQEETDAMD